MAETMHDEADGRPSLGGAQRPGAVLTAPLPATPLPLAPPPVTRSSYLVALALSVAWIALGVFVWYGTAPQGLVERALAVVSVVLPVGMIWVLAISLDQLRLLRAERERLQMVMDQMRLQAANPPAPPRPAPVDEGPRPTFASRRDAPPPKVEEQPTLALGPEDAPGEPLEMEDFLRAVHFPDTQDDTRAFAALKLALADHLTSKLIQAAQDVLNLLAEDGIYMDDLAPDRAKPELWRKFAAGERGRTIAALGGVRDRSCLALTAARMREDEIFRDVAHHFLRSFDKAFVAMEPRATDAQLSALSDTRTARAFMLFGRVTGTFD